MGEPFKIGPGHASDCANTDPHDRHRHTHGVEDPDGYEVCDGVPALDVTDREESDRAIRNAAVDKIMKARREGWLTGGVVEGVIISAMLATRPAPALSPEHVAFVLAFSPDGTAVGRGTPASMITCPVDHRRLGPSACSYCGRDPMHPLGEAFPKVRATLAQTLREAFDRWKDRPDWELGEFLADAVLGVRPPCPACGGGECDPDRCPMTQTDLT